MRACSGTAFFSCLVLRTTSSLRWTRLRPKSGTATTVLVCVANVAAGVFWMKREVERGREREIKAYMHTRVHNMDVCADVEKLKAAAQESGALAVDEHLGNGMCACFACAVLCLQRVIGFTTTLNHTHRQTDRQTQTDTQTQTDKHRHRQTHTQRQTHKHTNTHSQTHP